MNITQNNLTELSNYTEVWFRFDYNHTNVSSSIGNETQNDSEETDEAVQIVSIFFASVLALMLLLLVCCVCYLCCVECYDSHQRNYRMNHGSRYYYTSDSDFGNSSDSEADDNITSHIVIQTHTFSFEKKNKVFPKEGKIEETPLEKVVLGKEDSVDNITCSICLEKIDLDQEKVTQLSCQHIYHQDCISTWYFGGVTSVQSCPLCRTTMDHIVIQMDTI